MKKWFLLLFSFCHCVCAEVPWGADAELAYQFCEKEKAQENPKNASPLSLFSFLLHRIIRFHQVFLSPVDGPRSHFYPCSSQYMYNAIKKYGALKGYIIGCDRLLRENDEEWVYPTIDRNGDVVKYDPVE